MVIDLSAPFALKTFVVNPFYENSFLLYNKTTRNGLLVDPGFYFPGEERELSFFIDEEKLILQKILITHGHLDHLLGCGFVQERYSPDCIAPLKDQYLFDSMSAQLKMFGIDERPVPVVHEHWEDITELLWEGIKVVPLFTPGHTRGEYCLLLPELSLLFSGDVLFREGIGRTDLPGGDSTILMNSIADGLFKLPAETRVFPGHGEETSIGYELEHNPFFF